MRIKAGVSLTHVIEQVEGIIRRSGQVRTSARNHRQNEYLNWIEFAQSALSFVFVDSDVSDSLLHRGYWPIASASQSDTLIRLIGEEINYQAGGHAVASEHSGQLGKVLARLNGLLPLARRPGAVYVPDTNALMHYTRFDQLDWPSRLDVLQVRLVIPVAVVAEIDNKKYARRGELWDRARDLLALIDGYADGSPDGYSAVRDDVTVEILADEQGHLRLADTDQEILDRCDLLHAITGQVVTLITGDSAVRINARVSGLNVFKLSRDDLLPRHKPELNENPATTQQDPAQLK
jgi:hypothetical protein